MRYAIYFTPGQSHPLAQAAARWLGRDAFFGETMTPPSVASLSPQEIAYHTASARRYGFHATLKAPFHLAENQTEEALCDAVAHYADTLDPIRLDSLVPARIDGFLALVPGAPSAELQDLAGDVVRHFDRFRAPLSDAEIARRNPDALKPQEFRNLCQWGYPYVFESFRFHMTLTGRVDAADLPRVRAAVDEHFAPVLAGPAFVDALALFVEPEPGAPFVVKSWHVLSTRRDRKTA